jgi:hypothetical protein
MMDLSWTPIVTFSPQAQPVTVAWLMACETFGPATTHLKLTSDGGWTPLIGLPQCGPDGLVGQLFPEDRLVLTDCSVGALIGRIGGSSATLKALAPATDSGEGKPFPIGRYTIIKLPDKGVGPLFIGFNIMSRPVDLNLLKLDIAGGS